MLLKERFIWKLIRKLELEKGENDSASIDQDTVVKELLCRNTFLKFKDKHEITRIITSLINKELIKPVRFVREGEYGTLTLDGLHTEPAGDEYFAWKYFWHKPQPRRGFYIGK